MFIVNVTIAGQISPEVLAGVGIGNTTILLLTQTLLQGFVNAMDQLATRAYGNNQLELCGVYLNRGRMIMLTIFFPLALILYLFSEAFISLFSSDPDVIHYGASYSKLTFVPMFIMQMSYQQRSWLAAMRKIWIFSMIQVFSFSLYLPLSTILVFKYEMEIEGMALAMLITCSLTYCLNLLLTYCQSDIQEALFFPRKDSFQGWG